MRTLSRLLAALAVAILCLSPVAVATAVNADVVDDVSYAQYGGVQVDDTDIGRARNEIVVPEPDTGRARDEIVLPKTDVGRARNEVVVPESPAPVPTQTDTGLSDEAWTAIALSGAFVVVLGGIAFVARRRHHGHLAHPV